jgi:sugar transferase (PEP-CTERM/EpsH1 system associated)
MTTQPQAATAERSAASGTRARPTSVVHLVLTLNIGGLEKVVYDLAHFADRENFPVRVLCLAEAGDLGPAFEQIGVPVESLGVHGQGTLKAIAALARRLRALRPDVLHTHNAAPHIVGTLAGRWAGVPVVVHTRHGAHGYSGWKSQFANRLATFLTHRMVAVSAATAEVARSHDRISEMRLEIIRNGVDLDLYQPADGGLRTGCLRAIHAARLTSPVKDQPTLLRAVRLVVNQVPEFHLTIVGDGPDRPSLESLCDELCLRQHVAFLGHRHDMPELLRGADLFVLSSITEGLPMTLLEAMAAGLPIVSTDVGGISELVRVGQTGLLVPPQSPEALAAAILELVRDPLRAADMGRAARRRVEDEFDVRRVVAAYEGLYQKLFRERAGSNST